MTNLINTLNKFFVSAYKLVGFFILSAILLAMVGYLSISVFYLINRHWLLPQILSPTSEKVHQMAGTVASEQHIRDLLEFDLLEINADLQHWQSLSTANRRTLDRYSSMFGLQPVKMDGEGTEPTAAASASSGAPSDAETIASPDGSSVNTRFDAIPELLATHEAVAGLRSSLAARSSDLARAQQLLSLLAGFDRAVIDRDDAQRRYDALITKRKLFEENLKQQDQLLTELKKSPYYLASLHEISVAFVPYYNLMNVQASMPIYVCALDIAWCREVGKVKETLEGEVTHRHPHYNQEARGILVEIQLDDITVARKKMLIVDSKPLLF